MGRSVPVLTPSTTLSACAGDEVVVLCHEEETTANMRISLRWTIIPNQLHEIELPLSDLMNTTSRHDAGLQFYAELTSYNPLSAILIITAHPALDEATVTCAIPRSSDSIIIRVTQIGNPNRSCSS